MAVQEGSIPPVAEYVKGLPTYSEEDEHHIQQLHGVSNVDIETRAEAPTDVVEMNDPAHSSNYFRSSGDMAQRPAPAVVRTVLHPFPGRRRLSGSDIPQNGYVKSFRPSPFLSK